MFVSGVCSCVGVCMQCETFHVADPYQKSLYLSNTYSRPLSSGAYPMCQKAQSKSEFKLGEVSDLTVKLPFASLTSKVLVLGLKLKVPLHLLFQLPGNIHPRKCLRLRWTRNGELDRVADLQFWSSPALTIVCI